MSGTRNSPFNFISNTVKILAVDNDREMLTFVKDVLSPVKIYSVNTVSNSREGDRVLSLPQRKHLCVFELEKNRDKREEFKLLNKHSRKASFILFTKSKSPLKGFLAKSYNAKGVIEKEEGLEKLDFIRQINRYTLLSIINPGYGVLDDTLSYSTEVLLERSPEFVSHWARLTDISDRELRYIWRKNLGANAKIILMIYHMFNSAFRYYERHIANGDIYQNMPTENTKSYIRMEEYFHSHRSTIMDFINYAHIGGVV